MNNTLQRAEKATVGGAFLGMGVSLKLAEFGLHAGEVLASGAKNLANQFVSAPDIKIAEEVLKDVEKHTAKVGNWFIQKGKSY